MKYWTEKETTDPFCLRKCMHKIGEKSIIIRRRRGSDPHLRQEGKKGRKKKRKKYLSFGKCGRATNHFEKWSVCCFSANSSKSQKKKRKPCLFISLLVVFWLLFYQSTIRYIDYMITKTKFPTANWRQSWHIPVWKLEYQKGKMRNCLFEIQASTWLSRVGRRNGRKFWKIPANGPPFPPTRDVYVVNLILARIAQN